MQEMGQLWVDEEDPTKLVVNPNAWSNISSMLFLEAPAWCVWPCAQCYLSGRASSHSGCCRMKQAGASGHPLTLSYPFFVHLLLPYPTLAPLPHSVGYSYTDALIGCSHNDSSQAADNYMALRTFFTSFPEFQSNPLFLTGESYAVR